MVKQDENKIIKKIYKAGYVAQKKIKQNRIGNSYEVIFVENERYILEIETDLEQYCLIDKKLGDLLPYKTLNHGLAKFKE